MRQQYHRMTPGEKGLAVAESWGRLLLSMPPHGADDVRSLIFLRATACLAIPMRLPASSAT